MRKITLKIAIAVFTFIIGLSGAGPSIFYPLSILMGVSVDAVVTEEADEYAVYSTVISDLYLKDKENVKRLYISNRTSFHPNPANDFRIFVTKMKRFLPSANEDALADYDAKYAQP